VNEQWYRVECKHRNVHEAIEFYAEDTMDATIQAIGKVLNRAKECEDWALGHIKLIDEHGNVLHEMQSKG
jgi:hypothetical protein